MLKLLLGLYVTISNAVIAILYMLKLLRNYCDTITTTLLLYTFIIIIVNINAQLGTQR